MKANGITCLDYYGGGDGSLTFVLDCTADEALAMDTLIVDVETDDGDLAARFVNLVKISASVEAQSKQVSLHCAAATGDMAKAVSDIVAKVVVVEQAAAEAGGKAEEAKQTADEAKELAGQGGASPEITAAAKMYVNACALTNSQISDVRDLIESFVQGAEYKKGQVRFWDGGYYRMAKDIDSATSQTYAPGIGTESLYTLIDIASDGIRIWHMPTCSEDSFTFGEKAHYPDADGPVYVSKRVGNTSTPGTDEWWVLDIEEA